MPQPQWTLYCDESGNTGPNYLDAGQPFYVSAGVLVKSENIAKLNDACSRIFDRQGVAQKGTDLMNSNRGLANLVEFFNLLHDVPIFPFFMVFEKKLAFAGRILDFYCDPRSNQNAKWLPMTAKEERKRIANSLSLSLDDETINMFATAYKNTERGCNIRFLERLCASQAVAVAHERLKETIETALNNIDNILSHETMNLKNATHKLWSSLNLPAYKHMAVKADEFIDDKGKMSIIHHQIKDYDELIKEITIELRINTPDMNTDGGLTIRQCLKNFENFSSGDVVQYPGIRAADCLASCVVRLFKELSQESWTGNWRQLGHFILPLAYKHPPTHGMADVTSKTKKSGYCLAKREE